jgi:hypothetical protein
MSRSWLILQTGAALAALTGCTAAEQPSPAPVLALPSGPPAYYTGLRGECPVLKSPESVRFTGSRAGTHFPLPRKFTDFDRIDCGWRPPSGEPPWVKIAITIFLEPATAHEKAERSFTHARDECMGIAASDPSQAVRVAERATPYGSAFMVADARESEVTGGTDDLSQTTLVGNAVVVVSLFSMRDTTQRGSTRADGLMTGLATASEAITAEVASQLVSQA